MELPNGFYYPVSNTLSLWPCLKWSWLSNNYFLLRRFWFIVEFLINIKDQLLLASSLQNDDFWLFLFPIKVLFLKNSTQVIHFMFTLTLFWISTYHLLTINVSLFKDLRCLHIQTFLLLCKIKIICHSNFTFS